MTDEIVSVSGLMFPVVFGHSDEKGVAVEIFSSSRKVEVNKLECLLVAKYFAVVKVRCFA